MRIIAAALLAALCSAAQAAAVWDVDLHEKFDSEPAFSLVGQFTTAGIDYANGMPVLSFAGTFSDQFQAPTAVTLIPLGRNVSAGGGDVFVYDNVFYGEPRPGWSLVDAFDPSGLLLHAGAGSVNVFGGVDLVGYAFTDPDLEGVSLDGSITFHGFTSSVSEPSVPLLILAGAFLLCLGQLRAAQRREAGSDRFAFGPGTPCLMAMVPTQHALVVRLA